VQVFLTTPRQKKSALIFPHVSSLYQAIERITSELAWNLVPLLRFLVKELEVETWHLFDNLVNDLRLR
jgi:hypothetical protein